MSHFTNLLVALRAGDRQAEADLFSLVYDELRQLAAQQLAQESPGQTLQPTALVHEVYLRLAATAHPSAAGDGLSFDSRGHFFTAATEAMRRILIEVARRKQRQKRGGGRNRTPLDPDQIAAPELADDLLALDEALDALAQAEPLIAQLVKMRYFGGLTLKDAAATLGIAPRTADAYWAYARAWLLAEINRGEDAPP